MALQVQRRKASICQAYLAGNAVPEADRKALTMVEDWVEDFFESSAEDVATAMKDE